VLREAVRWAVSRIDVARELRSLGDNLSARLRRAWKQTASAAARHSPDGPPDRLFLGPGV